MSTDPRSKDYDLLLYHNHKFNERDFIIRRDLELYAEQFFREDVYALVLRQMARDPPIKHLIIHSSEVIDPSDHQVDCYVLYMPIERITSLNEDAQTLPKYTEIHWQHTGKHG